MRRPEQFILTSVMKRPGQSKGKDEPPRRRDPWSRPDTQPVAPSALGRLSRPHIVRISIVRWLIHIRWRFILAAHWARRNKGLADMILPKDFTMLVDRGQISRLDGLERAQRESLELRTGTAPPRGPPACVAAQTTMKRLRFLQGDLLVVEQCILYFVFGKNETTEALDRLGNTQLFLKHTTHLTLHGLLLYAKADRKYLSDEPRLKRILNDPYFGYSNSASLNSAPHRQRGEIPWMTWPGSHQWGDLWRSGVVEDTRTMWKFQEGHEWRLVSRSRQLFRIYDDIASAKTTPRRPGPRSTVCTAKQGGICTGKAMAPGQVCRACYDFLLSS